MIHVSMLHLHRDLAQTQAVPYEKCWIAATTVTSLTRELNDGDYNYLDPTISVRGPSVRLMVTLLTVPPLDLLAFHRRRVHQDSSPPDVASHPTRQ